MAGVGLRPEAERTLRGATARGVERYERVLQEGNVVAGEVQIALVDFRCPGKLVQILDQRPVRIMHEALALAEADAGDFFERLSFGIVNDLVIELSADDEIDGLGCAQALFRFDGNGRPDEATFILGLMSFIIAAILASTWKPGVEVKRTSNSKSLAIHGLFDGDL